MDSLRLVIAFGTLIMGALIMQNVVTPEVEITNQILFGAMFTFTGIIELWIDLK